MVWGLRSSLLDKNRSIMSESLNAEAGPKKMRSQIKKLKRAKSTKAERRFMELLKKLRIPFRYKAKIGGREVDFIIGNMAIEIDGHPQDVSKNWMLLDNGYNPIHFNSWEIPNPYLEDWLRNNGRFIVIGSASHNSKS